MLTNEEKAKIKAEEIFRKEVQKELDIDTGGKTDAKKGVLVRFLNSQMGLLVIGFVFTSIIGTYLSETFQEQSFEKQMQIEDEREIAAWKRDKKFEVLKRQLDEGQSSLEEISDLINLRFYRLQKVYNNINTNDLANAEKNWKEYFETVETWNVKQSIYQNKITRLVSPVEGQKFNNYETDNMTLENPKSIHGMFFVCHNKVFGLLKQLRKGPVPSAEINEVGTYMDNLDIESDAFVDRISTLFLKQAAEIDSL